MENELLDQVIRAISALGFPIFVAVYLLFRTDRILGEVRDAVKELTAVFKARREG